MSDASSPTSVSRAGSTEATGISSEDDPSEVVPDWQQRVVTRSLRTATKRSIDRGSTLIRAAATLLERSNGDGITVQGVANEAGQSLRTLYQYFESKDDLLLAVFEEAMKQYALMILNSIASLDDPLDRLVGGVIAAASMPAHSRPGINTGLARLRLKLGNMDAQVVALSYQPVTRVFLDLVREAMAAGKIPDQGGEPAAYMVLALKASYIISRTLGNDYGLELPDPEELTRFCIQGLGAELEEGWYASISSRLQAPKGARPGTRAAPGTHDAEGTDPEPAD